jgi:hypothetical protein
MTIKVVVTDTLLRGDTGTTIPGVIVTCTKCGKDVSVYGTGERSIRKGCVMLREVCPDGQVNFYSDKNEPVKDIPDDCMRLFWEAREILHTFEKQETIRHSSDRKYVIDALKRGLGCRCSNDRVENCPAHARISR